MARHRVPGALRVTWLSVFLAMTPPACLPAWLERCLTALGDCSEACDCSSPKSLLVLIPLHLCLVPFRWPCRLLPPRVPSTGSPFPLGDNPAAFLFPGFSQAQQSCSDSTVKSLSVNTSRLVFLHLFLRVQCPGLKIALPGVLGCVKNQ